MIRLKKIRDLTLKRASHPERPAFLSSASGLVRIGDWFYVVADDENHIGVFSARSELPGELSRVFKGSLPLKKERRKRKKADLEAIAHVGERTLLLVPSGSKRHRHRGACLTVGRDGSLAESTRAVDFGPLYDRLQTFFSDLNVEGAVAQGGSLYLFQRGNGRERENAVIDLDLAKTLECLERHRPLRSDLLRGIRWYDLGELDGVPLSFTDGTAMGTDRLLFTAAAEATDDPYEDGACAGSIVGVMESNGPIVSTHRLAPRIKAEGIQAFRQGKAWSFWLVNDEDAEDRCAMLYQGSVSPA